MPKEILKRGSTSNILRVFLQDSASTTGAGKTALTNASSGLIISTIADLEATATTYTSAASNVETITTLGTYAAPTASKCRFKEVDATNFPGVYEIHIADARFNVTNATQLLISIQCTGVAPVYVEYQLVAVDLMDTVRFGLTALPNTAVTTNGSLITAGTGTAQLSTTSGVALANTTQWNGVTVTGMPMPTYTQPTGFLAATFPTTVASTTNITAGTITSVTNSVTANTTQWGGVAVTGMPMPTYTQPTGFLAATFPTTVASTTNITGGTITTVSGNVNGSVGSVTGNVGGNVTGSVGSVTGNVGGNVTGSVGSLTATAVQNIWDDATSNNTVAGSVGKLIVDNLNATVSSRSTLTATDVWSATTRTLSAGTNIVLAKGTGITGFNDITVSNIWSEAIPGSYGAGTAAAKLNSASSAGDPWATALPGSYAAGTAGNILGNRLDAAISSRMATFTYTTPPTAAAISTQVWSETTRLLTAGTNIVLAKGTGITGFNDITSQSVWDVLASSVSLTNSIGLQLKTNVDATISSRLATSSYTAPLTAGATASAVWDALLASYTVNNSFGQRILRSSTSQSTCAVTGSNHIASDVHQMQPDVVTASAVASDATAEIADRVLGRTISGGADGGRTVTSALRILRNKFTAASTTLTVYAEDDVTTAWTSTLSTDAGATPITGSDPA